jgi:calcium-dependent protein kinase
MFAHLYIAASHSIFQVDILQHLGPSLNVAYCYGAYEEKGCVGIVMELLAGGELFSRIRTGQYSEKGAHPILVL